MQRYCHILSTLDNVRFLFLFFISVFFCSLSKIVNSSAYLANVVILCAMVFCLVFVALSCIFCAVCIVEGIKRARSSNPSSGPFPDLDFKDGDCRHGDLDSNDRNCGVLASGYSGYDDDVEDEDDYFYDDYASDDALDAGDDTEAFETLRDIAVLGGSVYAAHRFNKFLYQDPTEDYIGRHGEFDRNDEDRAYCEDMQQMRWANPDVDLEEQFGWENKLNYDSEGYGGDCDW